MGVIAAIDMTRLWEDGVEESGQERRPGGWQRMLGRWGEDAGGVHLQGGLDEVTGRLRRGNRLYVGNGWKQTVDEAGPLAGLERG